MIVNYAQPNSLEEIFNQVNNKPVVQPAQPTLPNYNNPFSQNSFINKNNYLGPVANSTPMYPPFNDAGVGVQPVNANVPVAAAPTPVTQPVTNPVKTNTIAPAMTAPKTSVATPTQVTPTAVPGSTQDAIVKAGLYNDYLTPEERQALSDTQAYQTSVATQTLDPNAEFQNSLKNYQQQIDSINSMYADRINQARIQGQGRIESRQFAQGRAGQIGSGVGEAGVNAVQNANMQEQDSIRAEQANAIANVYAKVKSGADESLAAKTLAKQQGASALVKHLSEKPEKIRQATATAVAELLSRGVDVKNMTPEEITSFTNGLGISKEQFDSEFKSQGATIAAKQKENELNQRKLSAEVKNLETKQDWEAAQKALDREMDQKKINVDWYQAETSRINASKKESTAVEKNYDAKTIPANVKQELFTDITENAKMGGFMSGTDKKTLNDFITAYPEINTDYLTALYEANQ